MKDGLLKLKDFPAEIGGTGEKYPRIARELGALRALLRMLVGLRAARYLLVRSDSYKQPFLENGWIDCQKSTTPFTGETISSRVSPNKFPTVPICSPSLTASPAATFEYHTPVLFV